MSLGKYLLVIIPRCHNSQTIIINKQRKNKSYQTPLLLAYNFQYVLVISSAVFWSPLPMQSGTEQKNYRFITLSKFADKWKRLCLESFILFHCFYCEIYQILQLLGSSSCFHIYSWMFKIKCGLAKNSENVPVYKTSMCVYFVKMLQCISKTDCLAL